MKKIRNYVLHLGLAAVGTSLLIAVSTSAQTSPSSFQEPGQMTHEEKVVRQTYAKLADAAQLQTIHEALDNRHITSAALDSRLAADQVQFHLTNLSSGKLSALTNVVYADLVTKPMGDVLAVAPGMLSYKEDLKEPIQEVTAHVMWTTGQELNENWDIPAGPALAQIENAHWYSRYAAFTMTMEFQGKSRTYKAIFLFGVNDKGEEEVLPIDTVTGNSALAFFVKQSVYPATLLKTNLRANPAVAGWLKSHQVFDAACKPGIEKACCDSATLACGVATEDVNSSLSQPVSQDLVSPLAVPDLPVQPIDCSTHNYLTGPKPSSAVGSAQHVTGSHNWTASQYGTCTYEDTALTIGAPCLASAASRGSSFMQDSGVLLPTVCHGTGYSHFDGYATGSAPTATGWNPPSI